MTTLNTATVTTAQGPLTLIVDGEALLACGFAAEPDVLQLRLDPARRGATLRRRGDLGAITSAVAAYFDGDLDGLEAVAVHHVGTDHQLRVWAALRAIPVGTTVTYAELAARIASPAAVRAVGSACGRNLIAPVVPCHRVVRSDGGLGGYAYGLERKRWLLEHERRCALPVAD